MLAFCADKNNFADVEVIPIRHRYVVIRPRVIFVAENNAGRSISPSPRYTLSPTPTWS